jgi:hypothetical protein
MRMNYLHLARGAKKRKTITPEQNDLDPNESTNRYLLPSAVQQARPSVKGANPLVAKN